MPPARDQFALSTAIFLRLLAVIHLIAFVSIWTQLSGLIGPHGILPAVTFLRAVHDQLGSSAYLQLPTLAWLFGAGAFLHVLCATGVLFGLLLLAGFAPALCLTVLWLAYLSLIGVGQSFLGFQWDALLLETTLFAIFLVPHAFRPPWRPGTPTALPAPSRVSLFLLRWLLFRLMLLSGLVKLTSGDPTWRNLTALNFHFETQPLPNPLAWWAHHASASTQRAFCSGMFVIELVVPFLLFAPRPLRHNAALLLAALQLAIALTGNFAFFNLLTLALCLLCLDDAWWQNCLPGKFHVLRETVSGVADTHPAASPLPLAPDYRSGTRRRASLADYVPALKISGSAFVVLYTVFQALPAFAPGRRPPSAFEAVASVVAPFRSLNNYGLFAVMTTSRPELIFEGSDDSHTWLAYELPYKPGYLARHPPVVAPHQPRLDWQLWFAALGAPEQNRWVLSVCEHLLRGTPEVLALFAKNPFPNHPPRYIRVVRYDYHFTSTAERARTGRWWRREPLDFYVPASSLR